MKPTITIGIPCYNQGQYLAHAIESCLDQTVKPHEIIVCNDGSTDETQLVADAYREQGVRVISQVNKGLASARNSLIMNAGGTFFLPLDSDDMLLENCLEKITRKIEETNADIIGLSFKCFGAGGGEVILMEHPTLADFKVGNRLAYCSAIRRSVLLECGGYNPRMDNVFRDAAGNLKGGWEDLALWFDLLSRGKTIVIVKEPVFLYRLKEQSMITESNAHAEELTAQLKKNFPFL